MSNRSIKELVSTFPSGPYSQTEIDAIGDQMITDMLLILPIVRTEIEKERIMSIEQERLRILAVVCPFCKSSAGQLCTQKITNAAGVQTKFTNIFHAERVAAAYTVVERQLAAIQKEISKNPIK